MKQALEANADREATQTNQFIYALFQHVRMNGAKRARVTDYLLKLRISTKAKPKLIDWQEAKRRFTGKGG